MHEGPCFLSDPTQLSWWEPASVLGMLSHRTSTTGRGARLRQQEDRAALPARSLVSPGTRTQQGAASCTEMCGLTDPITWHVSCLPLHSPWQTMHPPDAEKFPMLERNNYFLFTRPHSRKELSIFKSPKGAGGHAFEVTSGIIAAVARGALGPVVAAPCRSA